MLLKCCTQYANKVGKLISDHRTGKGQFSFKKAMPRNDQTTAQLQPSYMIAKWCSKFSKPGFNSPWTRLPDVHAGFRKGRGTRDQIANICWIIKKTREFQKNIYFCFIDYAKAFDWVAHNKLWKILQEMGIPDHPTCLLRNLYADQEATVRTNMKQQLVPNWERSTTKLYIVMLLI